VAGSWTTPADARAAVRKKWDSGALLGALARDDEWVPFAVPLRGPSAREIGARLADVQSWAASWSRAGPLRVEYKQVGGRQFGVNSIPARAWVDAADQAWDLLGVRAQVATFVMTIELTRRQCPELLSWLVRRPLRALELADRWPDLLRVVLAIADGPDRGYLRQLDVPGTDTKFIEKHRGVLGELLDLALPPSRVDTAAVGFERRYGFLRKPGYVRFRAGIAGFTELTVRADEFSAPPPGVQTVFVIENEITYLAFPRPDDAMVIWGNGYAVPVLEPLSWLGDLDVVYWGDIDTHGFVILDRLRAMFPKVRSMLMDRETLLAHRGQWVTEPSQARDVLTRLDAAETSLYQELLAGSLGICVRLEQERIGYGLIEGALCPVTSASGWRQAP
jgi:hypothetical protein